MSEKLKLPGISPDRIFDIAHSTKLPEKPRVGDVLVAQSTREVSYWNGHSWCHVSAHGLEDPPRIMRFRERLVNSLKKVGYEGGLFPPTRREVRGTPTQSECDECKALEEVIKRRDKHLVETVETLNFNVRRVETAEQDNLIGARQYAELSAQFGAAVTSEIKARTERDAALADAATAREDLGNCNEGWDILREQLAEAEKKHNISARHWNDYRKAYQEALDALGTHGGSTTLPKRIVAVIGDNDTLRARVAELEGEPCEECGNLPDYRTPTPPTDKVEKCCVTCKFWFGEGVEGTCDHHAHFPPGPNAPGCEDYTPRNQETPPPNKEGEGANELERIAVQLRERKLGKTLPVCPKCGGRFGQSVCSPDNLCSCVRASATVDEYIRHCAENTPCRECCPSGGGTMYLPVVTDDGGMRCPECKWAGTPSGWLDKNGVKETDDTKWYKFRNHLVTCFQALGETGEWSAIPEHIKRIMSQRDRAVGSRAQLIREETKLRNRVRKLESYSCPRCDLDMETAKSTGWDRTSETASEKKRERYLTKEGTIVFIINGENESVKVKASERLDTARDRALAQSGITNRPFEDFLIRDEKGVTLPGEFAIDRFHFSDGVRLFLMPQGKITIVNK